MSQHSNAAARAVRAVAGGAGGRLLVVTGEPGDGALFPAGMRREPAATLLEAVLSYAPGESTYPHVWVLSAADDALPEAVRVGREQASVRSTSCGWAFRGPGVAGLPAGPAVADPEDDIVAAARARRAARTELPPLLARFSGGWLNVVIEVAAVVERACGVMFQPNGAYGPAIDRPPGRVLVVLDERLLFPAGESDALRIADDAAKDGRDRAARRLNDIPNRVAESVARGAPADVILLARSPQRPKHLNDGRAVHDQFAAELRRDRAHLPPVAFPDPRLPRLRWPDVTSAEMPRVDRAHPLGGSFDAVAPADSLYRNLVSAVPQVVPDPLDALRKMTGLAAVKATVAKAFNDVRFDAEERRRGLTGESDPPLRHMVFAGNPGTGKTTVAKIVGRLYADAEILSGRKFTELSARDLVAGYVGQTVTKVEEAFEQASGGVLFLDEAAILTPRGEGDFNRDVVKLMVRWMTSRPNDLAFILAGYPAEMRDFLAADDGLRSRTKWVEFEDYTDQELLAIAREKVAAGRKTLAAGCEAALAARLSGHRQACARAGVAFSNGREVHLLLTAAREQQRARLNMARPADLTDEQLTTFLPEDVWTAVLSVPPPRAGGAV